MQSPIRAQRRVREQKTTQLAGLGDGGEGGFEAWMEGRCEAGVGGLCRDKGMESCQRGGRFGTGGDDQGNVVGVVWMAVEDEGSR